MANRDYGTEIDAIKNDLGALRTDLGQLIGSAGRAAGEQLRNGADRVRASADALVERGREGASSVGDQIERHPFASIFTALGVGIVIGRMFDRNGNGR